MKDDIKETFTPVFTPVYRKTRENDPVEFDFLINSHRVLEPRNIANAFSNYGKGITQQIPNSNSDEEYSLDP